MRAVLVSLEAPKPSAPRNEAPVLTCLLIASKVIGNRGCPSEQIQTHCTAQQRQLAMCLL